MFNECEDVQRRRPAQQKHVANESTRTNPLRLRYAAMQGLYYVQIMNLGTVASATNYHPWRDYTPKPEWLEGWWLGQKLSHA